MALEEGKADDENVLEGLAALLLDELAGGGGRATSGNEVAVCQPSVSAIEQQMGSGIWPESWAQRRLCSPPSLKSRSSPHSHTRQHSLKDNDSLARLDGALLHLEAVDSVLLLELGDLALAGQLAGLADGDEGGTEAHGNDGAEEEATGVKADNHVGLGRVLLRDVRDEVGHERLERVGVAQDGEDVEERDALKVS